MAPSTWGELDRAPLMPQFPRLVAVRPRFGAVWRPKCRPPRRKTPKLGCRRRGGLRYGHNGVKSRVLWRLVEAASFRVVVCWFSACCGVMPPRARWGRRVLYQWTQAAVSRSTARRSRHGRVAGARLVVDQFCFAQGVQRFGQGAIVGVTGRTHRLLPGNRRELARSTRRGIGRLGRSSARAHECLYHRGDVGRSPCSTRPGPHRHAARTRLSSPRFYASTRR